MTNLELVAEIAVAVNKHGMPIVELIKAYDALENERDRLRDIVRRLADNLSRYHLVGERESALLREARAAIGEDRP